MTITDPYYLSENNTTLYLRDIDGRRDFRNHYLLITFPHKPWYSPRIHPFSQNSPILPKISDFPRFFPKSARNLQISPFLVADTQRRTSKSRIFPDFQPKFPIFAVFIPKSRILPIFRHFPTKMHNSAEFPNLDRFPDANRSVSNDPPILQNPQEGWSITLLSHPVTARENNRSQDNIYNKIEQNYFTIISFIYFLFCLLPYWLISAYIK